MQRSAKKRVCEEAKRTPLLTSSSLLLLFSFLALNTIAQVPPVLTRDAFVRIVLENHPMARQAALRPELGEATVRSARGGFDPMATAAYDEKQLDDKNYFQLFDAGLKVPTWYGVELFAGYQENSGDLLDPQNSTPADGLLKVGGQVSIGQGLFIDQRRATLRKSQAYLRATRAEQEQMLNDLLLQALHDHTDWVAAYRALEVANTAVGLTEIRFDAVRGSWRGGDRPAIDTLEAFLQLQDRRMRQQQASLNFRNASLRLSNHLWNAAQQPLELQPSVVPEPGDLRSPETYELADTAINSALTNHPLLTQASARIDQLEVDRRLRAELLKPDLDLKYQWLGDGGALSNEQGTTLLGQGYRFGVGFQMPLFLRRERGELAIAKLRLTDANLGLDRDRLRIRNRINERLNDINTFAAQVRLGAEMVVNNERLLAGENQRFSVGESSLFLVNAREVPLIDTRIRQVELEARLRKAYFSLDHEAGTLWRAWRR
ncbi:MAG: TolC family protein [Flavobacteriales bacterium]|nr:TolC family protein [Flavobacteriales bacterium]